ncbi:MAG: cell division protein FtsL [Nitrosomonadales bacterium]|nr:cell division protein FtsL [Nitrosomonadales bacterium]
MIRVNLLLLLVAIACALGVVTSQHKARKLFVELQKEKDRAQQMEVEWGQLQLEQGAWAMAARVEKIAVAKLQMQLPASDRIRFVRMKERGAQP